MSDIDINTGGPVLPRDRPNFVMGLRDYFAARAMQALIGEQNRLRVDVLASEAYQWADAMIKARAA